MIIKKSYFRVRFPILGMQHKIKEIIVLGNNPKDVKKYCKKAFGSINKPFDVTHINFSGIGISTTEIFTTKK